MVKCKRCGLCCHFIIDGKLTGYKCDYLLYNYDIAVCVIYDNPDRIGVLCGTVINDSFNCNERKNTPYDYPGCPYNKNKKIVKI